jgi:hypothetical protein
MMGWGVYYFCSGVLVVRGLLDFFTNFEMVLIFFSDGLSGFISA